MKRKRFKKKKESMKWNGEEPGMRGVLKELAFGGEDDQSNICITKNRDLMGLFEQTSSTLWEGDLAADFVLYSLQLNSASSHAGFPDKINPNPKKMELYCYTREASVLWERRRTRRTGRRRRRRRSRRIVILIVSVIVDLPSNQRRDCCC